MSDSTIPNSNHDETAPSASAFPSSIRIEDEKCVLTKTVSSTHKQVQWMRAIGDDDKDVEALENAAREMGIVEDDFYLENGDNFSCLDSFVYDALVEKNYVAITCDIDTVDQFIDAWKRDVEIRQEICDDSGENLGTTVNIFDIKAYDDARYQLVVLHPEQFLPPGRQLMVYDPITANQKYYEAHSDGLLYEAVDSRNLPLPPFAFEEFEVNPLLVVWNAALKFETYIERLNGEPIPFHGLAKELIDKTMELYDLVRWEPQYRVGTKGWDIHVAKEKRLAKERERVERYDLQDKNALELAVLELDHSTRVQRVRSIMEEAQTQGVSDDDYSSDDH